MTRAGFRLTFEEHHRDSAGLTYVYPVVARRARGVSIGVNLNSNDACNWRCVYCQVPGLTRGSPPPIDVPLLERELQDFLGEVVHGDFMQQRVPADLRRLNDVAISGNGEPTSAREFPEVIEAIGRAMAAHELVGRIKLVLITNGSLVHQRRVQTGLARMAALNGEVWFKLDRATEAGIRAVNNTRTTMDKVLRNLRIAAGLCPTWIQTCMFGMDGVPPAEAELQSYLECLAGLQAEGIPLRGVQLYGFARRSYQPEAPRLSQLPESWLDAFAQRIKAKGLTVSVSP
jgi:wyosine [tRNA(Phe)-imidazoG37] synthetase (radical SAM superfamily)